MDELNDPTKLTKTEEIQQEVNEEAETFDEGANPDSNEPVELNQEINITNIAPTEPIEDVETVVINNGLPQQE